jgi:ABC-2 type transport system permease protein
MNIYIHELKRNAVNTLVWMAVIGGLCFFFFSIYPAFSKDVEVLMAFIKKFPEPVQKALQLDMAMATSVTGFFAFFASFLVLSGALQALSLGLSLTAREVTGKTLDFLLTKPVSRTSALTQKLSAGLSCLIVTNIWFFIAVILAAWGTGAKIPDLAAYLLIAGSFGCVQAIFFTGGFFAGVFFRKIKSTLSMTLTVCFALFIIKLFSNAVNDEKLRLISPFAYFNYDSIMKTAAYEVPYIILDLALIAIFCAGAYVVFRRKDFTV